MERVLRTFHAATSGGARLIAPELPLFIVALTLLGANSMIRLFMPNYQGSIIQDIINAHHACTDEARNHTAVPPLGNATRGGECEAHKRRRHQRRKTKTEQWMPRPVAVVRGGRHILA